MFISKLGFIIFSKFFGRAIDMVRQIILARVLSPALFGAFVVGMSIFRIVILFTPFGINKSVIYLGGKWHQDPKAVANMIRQALLLGTFIGAMGAGILLLLRPVFVDVFQQAEMILIITWIAVAVFADTISIIAVNITLITQTVRYITLVEQVIQPIAYFVLLIIIFAIATSLEGALIAMASSYILSAIIAIIFVIRLFPKVLDFSIATNNNHYRALLGMGFSGILAGGLINLSLLFDRIMVGLLRPMDEAGIFGVISQLVFIAIMLIESLANIIEPLFSVAHEKKDQQEIKMVASQASYWILIICVPFILLLLFCAPEIIDVLFGSEYQIGSLGLQLFSIALLLRVLTLSPIVMSLLIMTQRARIWLYMGVATLILNVLCNVIFIPEFGYLGAVTSNIVSSAFIGFMSLYLLYRHYNMPLWDGEKFKIIIIYLGVAFLMLLVRLELDTNMLFYILLQGIIVGIPSLIMLIYYITQHNPILWERIRLILNKNLKPDQTK